MNIVQFSIDRGVPMSDFDDLFKKDDDIFFQPQKTASDPENDIQDLHNEQRVNRTLILVYVGIMFLMTLFSYLYFQVRFSDVDAILENLAVETTLHAELVPIVNETYDYQVNISGRIRNTNNVTIPRVWVSFAFSDAEGKVFYSHQVFLENVAANDVFIIDDTLFGNETFHSYDTTYGIDETNFFYIAMNLVQMAITGFIFIIIDKRALKRDFIAFRKKLGMNIGMIVSGFIMVYVALYLSQLFMDYVLNVTSDSQNEQMIASMFSPEPLTLIALFFLLCILTPLVEELIFRKVIFNFFHGRFGNVAAVIISGLIFGIMHVVSFSDYLQAIPYVMMGMVFGVIYLRANKNIFVPIGVHVINNLISFLIYYFMITGGLL
jgi:membrane protease YdiL (CAAX protease family)